MRLLFLLAFSLLAGCNRSQSFDEKYREQSDHISTTANSIERQVTQQLSGAAEAEQAANEVKARTPASAGSPTPP